MIERYKQPLLTILIGLVLLELFALAKPAILFPGLATRTLWALIPVAILTSIANMDFPKLLKRSGTAGDISRACWRFARSEQTKRGIEVIFSVLVIISLLAASGLEPLKPIGDFIEDFGLLLFFVAFGLGVLIIYQNRKLFRKKSFWEKTQPRFANDLEKYRWIFLIVLLVLAASLYTYNLGGFDLREDEFQVVDAATGYLKTGTFYKWNWIEDQSGEIDNCEGWSAYCHYTRAWPHTWLIAQSYKLFGISEWSSRIVSVLFGLIAVLLFYLITAFFTESEAVAILCTLSFICYSAFINIFRYTRMYALLIPLTMLFAYLLYRGLAEKEKHQISKVLERYLNFRYTFIIAAIIILILGVFIHINILVLIPSTFLFLIYLAWKKKEARYKISATIGSIGILLVVAVMIFTDAFTKIAGFLSFFGRDNIVYFTYAAKYPLAASVGLALLALSIVIWAVMRDEKLQRKVLFLILTVGFSLVFFAFIANRYASFAYISHVVPFAIVLTILSLWSLMRVFESSNTPIVQYIIVIALLVGLGSSIISHSDYLFSGESTHGKFSEAYPTIVHNYRPDETIFAQYFRRYYARDLAPGTKIVGMKFNRMYSFEMFISDVQTARRGWVVWESRKDYHIDPYILGFVSSEFEKLHGRGVDETNIEVYRFNETHIHNIGEFLSSFENSSNFEQVE